MTGFAIDDPGTEVCFIEEDLQAQGVVADGLGVQWIGSHHDLPGRGAGAGDGPWHELAAGCCGMDHRAGGGWCGTQLTEGGECRRKQYKKHGS